MLGVHRWFLEDGLTLKYNDGPDGCVWETAMCCNKNWKDTDKETET